MGNLKYFIYSCVSVIALFTDFLCLNKATQKPHELVAEF